MKVKWVNSSSVLSWIYWAMSLSSTGRAAVYCALPLPPGTSLSWMPPSSLYCCQKSVSRISAADRNRRMAASPGVRPPLSASAKAGTPLARRAAPMAPAPTAASPFRQHSVQKRIHNFGKVIPVLVRACSLPDQVLLRTICQKVLHYSLKECSSVLYLPLAKHTEVRTAFLILSKNSQK